MTGNVSLTCRYFGITRPSVLQVAAALRGAGPGRAQGPLTKAAPDPVATKREVVSKIVYLRHFLAEQWSAAASAARPIDGITAEWVSMVKLVLPVAQPFAHGLNMHTSAQQLRGVRVSPAS